MFILIYIEKIENHFYLKYLLKYNKVFFFVITNLSLK